MCKPWCCQTNLNTHKKAPQVNHHATQKLNHTVRAVVGVVRQSLTCLKVRAAKKRAVVVIEHDMEFVRRLNCKVTVLHQGSVLAEGSLNHVTKNQDVIDVYLGR